MALAHELGHSLGLNHDEPMNGTHLILPSPQDDNDIYSREKQAIMLQLRTQALCRCDMPGNYCVMWPSIWFKRFPPQWSSCSRERLTKPPPNYPMDICLRNRPQKARGSSVKSYCGDLVVDSTLGEQCDCGPAQLCRDTAAAQCCNPSTCKFVNSTVQCANGPCCDSSTCSFLSRDTVCREPVNECDLPERCSGSSLQCPTDLYKYDASDCFDDGGHSGYCYRGWCRTVRQQCRAILGKLVDSPQVSDYDGDKFCTRYAHCVYTQNSRNLRPETYQQCREQTK